MAVGLIVAAAVSLGLVSAASAQTIINVNPNCVQFCTAYVNVNIFINITIVAPGGTVIVTGNGFVANSPITIIVASTPTVVGTPIADAAGNFSLTFAAPTEIGEHTVTADDGSTVATTTFTVAGEDGTAATPVAVAGTLPYTGSSSSLPVAQVGAGLVAAGAVLVLCVRKRQQHGATVKVDS